jgi:hypothetical protein
MFFGAPESITIQGEIAAMRAELASIRAAQQDSWVTQERATQIRSVVQDVLADSATRESFRTDGAQCGYDHGAFIRSSDGCWTFKIGIMDQTRFVFNSASNQVGDDNTWGMETHRINITFSGTLVDPSISWMLLGAYNSQADRFITVPNELRPLYAWVRKDFGDGLTGTVGLQNVPWDIESEFFGSSRITAGEYSIFNYRFGAGKETGISAKYQCDWWRATAGTFSQLNESTESWDSTSNLSYAVAMRAEAKLGAEWSQLEWQSSLPNSTPGAVFGFGTVWSSGRAQNPESPPTPSAQGFTTDVRATLSGTTLIAQFALLRDPAGLPQLAWASGVNMQGSTFLTDNFQVFGEGSWMDGADVPWIAQCGMNFYFSDREVKLTTRVIVPFGSGEINGTRKLAGGLGLADSGNNASLIVQLQVMF